MSTSLVKRKFTTWKFTDPSVDVSDLTLSPFQIEKLSYLFKCLDTTGDGYINVSLLLILKNGINMIYSEIGGGHGLP